MAIVSWRRAGTVVRFLRACLPEYRNRGLNRHFGRFTMRFLAAQGYAEEFGVITASNIASLRSVLGRGSEFVYFVWYSRVLFYEHFQMSDAVPIDDRCGSIGRGDATG